MRTATIPYNKIDNKPESTDWNRCLEEVAKTGDRRQFMLLYDHFSPRLNAWLQGLTADPALAEDLVQETMLNIWRKACQYNSTKALASTWVFRIARNVYIDHLRRQQASKRSTVLVDEDALMVTVNYAEAIDAKPVRAAIKKLSVQQAQVLYQSYFAGQSHQEIAAAMDLPLGSVKSSLRLAFRKLSKIIGNRYDG
jgi:RNA polymerase sigma-70 factor (ECF subfamily)